MAHTKVTKTGTQNTGTANTFSYSGSFNVFKASEVEVELDNVALTFTTSTINESASPREYTVDYSAKTIHIGGADLAGTNSVVIQPVTDMGDPTPRATYAPGSSVTSDDLNNNQLQLMRKAMEYDEQKLSSRGGTMTGNLHLDKNIDITFEGDTDNAYETTLTVADPTSDKTITFPDTTGTVVTTGDTATVTATMLAANSVDSSELVDGSIDTSHIADSQVTAAKLGSSAVTTVKLATDAVTTAKITDANVTTAKIADDAVTADKLANTAVTAGSYTATDLTVDAQGRITSASSGTIGTSEIAADAITGAKIADDAVDSEHLAADSIDAEHYAAGSVDTTALGTSAVTTAKIADDAITSLKIAAGNVTNTELGTGAVGTNKLAADAVTNAKIADDSIDSEHYVDGSIDTAHIASAQVTDAKLASNSVITSKITDANVTTVKIADDAISIAKIGCEQTTISDSDSHIPTSGAVVDYVAAQIAPIGGLEVIADEDNFPTSQPSSGVVISISDAAGIVVNGSGVSTTARTAGNGSDNVTINNFPSSLYSETLASGVGLMVSSTGSSHTYNYHKLLAAETDVKQLSDDINDFNARYRVNAGEPGSNNDEGDLVFDTNANKMKVYDGSSWGEVTSTGDFKFLVPVDAGTTTAATFDGSDTSFDLKETTNSGSAASVTNVNQLIVSLNGVIQKPNTGSYNASEEGFYLTDADTIRFCTAPATGSSCFIIQCGSAVSIPTPGDGTVTAAKIASGAVTTAKIADDAVDQQKIADNSILNANINSSAAIARTKLANVDVVDDTSPQLGGNLDGNGFEIALDSDKAITFDGKGSLEYKSSQFQITNSTGDILIDNNYVGGDVKIYTNTDFEVFVNDGEEAIVAKQNGAVELYHDDVKKFETTSYGGIFGDETAASAASPVRLSLGGTYHSSAGGDPKLSMWTDGTQHMGFGVSGNQLDVILTEDAYDFVVYGGSSGTTERFRVNGDGTGIQLPDSSKALFGASNDISIFHDGTNSYLEANNTGNLYVGTTHSANLTFQSNNTNRWSVNSSGHLLPETNNTYDLGSTSYRVRNIFTNDLHLSNEGSSNDVDGTWGDWTIQEGESDLFLKNNRSGKKYKFNLTEVS